MKKSSFPISLALLLAAASLSACEWDSSVYDTYVGPKGYVSICAGYCALPDQLSLRNKDTCDAIKANWNDDLNLCILRDIGQCEAVFSTLGIEWSEDKWHPRAGTYLGGNRYIVKLKDDNGKDRYICGSYDYVTNRANMPQDDDIYGTCDKTTDVAKLEEQLKGNICDIQSDQCIPLTIKPDVSNSSNTENNDSQLPETIAICSYCGEGMAACSLDGTSSAVSCFDLKNDPKHCGNCNITCSSEESCQNGICTAIKCDGELCSDGKCVEENNPRTCGLKTCEEYENQRDRLGKVRTSCPVGSTCEQNEEGSYTCKCLTDSFIQYYEEKASTDPEDNTPIEIWRCIDPASDDNCGASENSFGTECTDNTQCIKDNNGIYSCQSLCSNGKIYCEALSEKLGNNRSSDNCYDPLSKEYCGLTSEMCNDSGTELNYVTCEDEHAYCSNLTKKCECEAGFIMCGNKCYNPNSNEYCGLKLENCEDIESYTGCDTRGGQICNNGECVCDTKDGEFKAYCPTNTSITQCIETMNNSYNNIVIEYCGAMGLCNSAKLDENYRGVTCLKDQDCVDGQCQCREGFAYCNGICIDPQSDNNFCGAGVKASDQNTACIDQVNSDSSPKYLSAGDKCSTHFDKKENTSECHNGKCVCVDGTVPYPDYDHENFICVNPLDTDHHCGHPDGKIFEDCTSYSSPTISSFCNNGKCECASGELFEEKDLEGTVYSNKKKQCIDVTSDPNYCKACLSDEMGQFNPNTNCDTNLKERRFACKIDYFCITNETDGTLCKAPECKGELKACFNSCIDTRVYHLNVDCTSCTEDYCDSDNMLSNGCDLNKVSLHLAICPKTSEFSRNYCELGWADSDNNWKNGCDIDLNNDNKNCGDVDNECAYGSQCVDGSCKCTEGFIPSDACTSWINPSGTSTSLGAPLARSINPIRCISPEALHFDYNKIDNKCTCHTGWAHLDGTNGCLVNYLTDPEHCGTTLKNCSTNLEHGSSVCSNGNCVIACDPNYTLCGDSCSNLESDRNNCGMCNNVCPIASSIPNSTSACWNYTCYYVCSEGYGNCYNNNTCVPLSTKDNCGACNRQCNYPNDDKCENQTCCRDDRDEIDSYNGEFLKCCGNRVKCKKNNKYKCSHSNGNCESGWSPVQSHLRPRLHARPFYSPHPRRMPARGQRRIFPHCAVRRDEERQPRRGRLPPTKKEEKRGLAHARDGVCIAHGDHGAVAVDGEVEVPVDGDAILDRFGEAGCDGLLERRQVGVGIARLRACRQHFKGCCVAVFRGVDRLACGDFVAVVSVIKPGIRRDSLNMGAGDHRNSVVGDEHISERFPVILSARHEIAEIDEEVVVVFSEIGEFIEHVINGNIGIVMIGVCVSFDGDDFAVDRNGTINDRFMVCDDAIFECIFGVISEVGRSCARFPEIRFDDIIE